MSETHPLGVPNSEESLANSRALYGAAIGVLLGSKVMDNGGLYVDDSTTEGVSFRVGVFPDVNPDGTLQSKAEQRKVLEAGGGWLSFGDVTRYRLPNDGNPPYYALRPGEVSASAAYIVAKIDSWLGYEPPAMEPVFYSATQSTVAPDPFMVPYLSNIYQRLVELRSES